jgi:hypothetical protein
MWLKSEGFVDKVKSFFFFDKSKYIKKRERGATHSTQEVYKGKPRRGKKDEKENPES